MTAIPFLDVGARLSTSVGPVGVGAHMAFGSRLDLKCELNLREQAVVTHILWNKHDWAPARGRGRRNAYPERARFGCKNWERPKTAFRADPFLGASRDLQLDCDTADAGRPTLDRRGCAGPS
jgi:hypothetical protein